MTTRATVFTDAQNMYRWARRAFFDDEHAPGIYGQFDPMKLANYLVSSRHPTREAGTINEVRIYTGRPDSRKDPKSHAAHMRQCQSWEKSGVLVFPRTLRYPNRWPEEKAIEKGIDVSLAIDFVRQVHTKAFDVGIIASTDTDLIPALEFALEVTPTIGLEVVAWWSDKSKSYLKVDGYHVWCHRLGWDVYQILEDTTNYSKS